MRLKLLTILGVLLLSSSAWATRAGYTAVTAQVLDPIGNAYVNCRYSVNFINLDTTPGDPSPNLNGSVFQQVFTGAVCDSSGNLSITVADNNVVTPTPSKWQFNICDQSGKFCFSAQITITGSSQNITTQLQAASATIINTGGFVDLSTNQTVAGNKTWIGNVQTFTNDLNIGVYGSTGNQQSLNTRLGTGAFNVQDIFTNTPPNTPTGFYSEMYGEQLCFNANAVPTSSGTGDVVQFATFGAAASSDCGHGQILGLNAVSRLAGGTWTGHTGTGGLTIEERGFESDVSQNTGTDATFHSTAASGDENQNGLLVSSNGTNLAGVGLWVHSNTNPWGNWQRGIVNQAWNKFGTQIISNGSTPFNLVIDSEMPYNISGSARASNVDTFTLSSCLFEGLPAVGSSVVVANVPLGGNGTNFNGTYTVVSVGGGGSSYACNFTVVQTAADDTATTGGTATLATNEGIVWRQNDPANTNYDWGIFENGSSATNPKQLFIFDGTDSESRLSFNSPSAGNSATDLNSAGTAAVRFNVNGSATGGVQFGSGTAVVASINASGIATLNGGIVAAGTAATLSGTGACSATSAQKGGAWAGQIECTGTTGASTLTITPGNTAPNGMTCHGSDTTSGHELVGAQSGISATTCKLTFTSVTSNDVLAFDVTSY